MLFYRDYRRFSGGHLKVWHYYRHMRSSADYHPEIVFSDESVWDAMNPWFGAEVRRAAELPTMRPDMLFVAGMDWEAFAPYRESYGPIPAINLIQHVMHADRDNPRFRFLANRAIRICVSEDVRLAMAETGQVNGPLYVIPNGLDTGSLPAPAMGAERDIDLLLDGIKVPQLTQQILPLLGAMGLRVHAITGRIPRREYLDKMRRARMTLFLPRAREGFYLPALEGMALGTLVICPDCVGNRSFCLPGVNSLRPEYRTETLLQAVDAARSMDAAQVAALAANARDTVVRHDLMAERSAFLDILADAGRLWR